MILKVQVMLVTNSIFQISQKSKKPHISVKLLRGEYRIRTDDPYTASVVL